MAGRCEVAAIGRPWCVGLSFLVFHAPAVSGDHPEVKGPPRERWESWPPFPTAHAIGTSFNRRLPSYCERRRLALRVERTCAGDPGAREDGCSKLRGGPALAPARFAPSMVFP